LPSFADGWAVAEWWLFFHFLAFLGSVNIGTLGRNKRLETVRLS
jgi:hypothetical protein